MQKILEVNPFEQYAELVRTLTKKILDNHKGSVAKNIRIN